MTGKSSVWVVDDDASIRWVLEKALSNAGFAVTLFDRADDVLKRIGREQPDVIVTDIRMPGTSGLELLDVLGKDMPGLPVIVMTAYSDLDSAVSAYQGGAFEYLPKPFDLEEAVALVGRALQKKAQVEVQVTTDEKDSEMIGAAPAMQTVFRVIGRLSGSQMNVLISGESGTGKELVAEAIHQGSDRRTRPFIAVNCAAIPEGVIESELFGHERGAFTGALAQRKGRFELAHRGTLFLDEVGDLSLANQIKLLRVLQERQFERLGGNNVVKVDVRVIAATSRDLDQMVKSGAFRADLYYRLAVFPIRLPPLRERTGDITLLTNHFVEKFNRAHGRSVQRVSTNAIDMLVSYHWPGNVRELENCIERAVVLSRDDVLQGHHFPPTLQTADATNTRPAGNLKSRLAAFERELILDALKANRGNRAAAARELGLTERIMGLRVQKYGIDARRFRVESGE